MLRRLEDTSQAGPFVVPTRRLSDRGEAIADPLDRGLQVSAWDRKAPGHLGAHGGDVDLGAGHSSVLASTRWTQTAHEPQVIPSTMKLIVLVSSAWGRTAAMAVLLSPS